MASTFAPIFKVIAIDTIDGSVDFAGPTDTNNPASTGRTANHQWCMSLVNNNNQNTFGFDSNLKAGRIWNSVWNDYADFQLLSDKLVPGKCYYDTSDGAMICKDRCQLSVIGIASDTFAQVVGLRQDIQQVPIAVSGWALAFVDQEYPCGTPLTNNENGDLTEMTLEEKRNYPERLVAIYKRKEIEVEFGTETKKIQVNGRHWVKVK